MENPHHQRPLNVAPPLWGHPSAALFGMFLQCHLWHIGKQAQQQQNQLDCSAYVDMSSMVNLRQVGKA